MSFTCKPCHEEYDCDWDNHFTGSRGPCEDCGKIADCVDCHAFRKPPRKRTKERTEFLQRVATEVKKRTATEGALPKKAKLRKKG